MTAVPGGSRRCAAAAVVVAGGSARRMGGVDKLALEVGGRTILDRVLAAARPLCVSIVAVGPPRGCDVEGVSFISEAEPGGGPVPAVAAGMIQVAAGDGQAVVAVLAADLPLLTTTHLEVLFAALDDPSVQAAAAVDERGRPHPLLAVHRVPALRARLAQLGPGPAGVPAARLLPSGVVPVELGPEATLNVNRPTDLDRARALIGARR